MKSFYHRFKLAVVMKHFQPLERCSCGAYRYLAARELGRSYEIVLIHQTQSKVRKYRKVATVPKLSLEFHDRRNNESSGGDAFLLDLLQTARHNLALVTKLQSRTKTEEKEPAPIE